MIPSLMVASVTSTPFSPTQIAGLKLWLKADSLVLSDNDPVSTWSDQSGNGNDVSQSVGTRKPIYKTNIQNSLPSVRFDRSVFQNLDGTFTFSYGSAFSVANFNAASFPDYCAIFSTNTGATNSDNYFTGDGAGSLTTFYTTGTAFDSSHIWVNKVQTIEFATLSTIKLISGVDTTPASKTSISIGVGNPSLGNRWWNGDILEIIIYDTALSDNDRIRVENYLNSKYALF